MRPVLTVGPRPLVDSRVKLTMSDSIHRQLIIVVAFVQ